jgi:glycolate oxidase FAD binding subunit
MTLHHPKTEAEIVSLVRELRAQKAQLGVSGGGTRAGLGRPMPALSESLQGLSTDELTGITLYEPAEMVIAARAGTPVADIERLLGERGQMLPFEPMDHRALYGSVGDPTIGAVASCNISGPRRIQVGAARDHLIGVRLVNGRGEAVKSGGRVMKNVTGLDLVKLVCGAHGTLGILTEVTFKVLPRPQDSGTLAIEGLDDERAIACMSAALGSPYEVSAAAHLPAGLAADVACTFLRIENAMESVHYRLNALAEALGRFGPGRRLPDGESRTFWRDLRDAGPLVRPASDAVWRVSVAPSRGAELVRRVRERLPARWYYDWGGGLIWLATPPDEDCGAAVIRAALAGMGGHATLVRAPDAIRARVDVFEPLAAPLLRITRGVKQSFDPDHLFNPGRMYAGV